MSKNGLILGAFALLSIGLIAVFHQLTKDKIAAEMQAKLARTLAEIISKNEYDNDIYHDCTKFVSTDPNNRQVSTKVYRMRKQGLPVASVFSVVAPDGYNGKIELILAIYSSGELSGVRVLQHEETPGLGDKIEYTKNDWITQFRGLSLSNTAIENWKVKKDGGQFDAFTGATITPRAVLKAIGKALEFHETHYLDLFSGANNCGEKS